MVASALGPLQPHGGNIAGTRAQPGSITIVQALGAGAGWSEAARRATAAVAAFLWPPGDTGVALCGETGMTVVGTPSVAGASVDSTTEAASLSAVGGTPPVAGVSVDVTVPLAVSVCMSLGPVWRVSTLGLCRGHCCLHVSGSSPPWHTASCAALSSLGTWTGGFPAEISGSSGRFPLSWGRKDHATSS